jgi:hypothetical protein
MAPPTSRIAYTAEYDILDRALKAQHGIQVRMRDWGQAKHLQMRLHKARTLDRALASEIHNDHERGSVYDKLIVQVTNDGDDVVVTIRHSLFHGEIEELPA